MTISARLRVLLRTMRDSSKVRTGTGYLVHVSETGLILEDMELVSQTAQTSHLTGHVFRSPEVIFNEPNERGTR